MPRTIHHTFGPHVDTAMLGKMLALSYQPWSYVRGSAPKKLKIALQNILPGDAFLFASGRESLLALLRTLAIRAGEEVIVQGYTCVVVPNAIHAAGGVPIYADIDPDTLNITVESVDSCITERTRAVIVQHTFGISCPVRKLKEYLKDRNIVLIEDLAHVLPDNEKRPGDLGYTGDYSILSFGRDKAISGVSGGAVMSRHPEMSAALQKAEESAEDVSWWTVLRHLEYGPRMHSLVRPFAGSVFLKMMIKLLTVMHLIEPVLTKEEKQGNMPIVLQKIPNACAALVLTSLKGLADLNEHRRKLTTQYLEEARTQNWTWPKSIESSMPLQKFPIFVKNAETVRQALMKKKIFLHDGWNTCVICPESVDIDVCGYAHGQAPAAEDLSLQILNLPTHGLTTMKDAARLLEELRVVLQQMP